MRYTESLSLNKLKCLLSRVHALFSFYAILICISLIIDLAVIVCRIFLSTPSATPVRNMYVLLYFIRIGKCFPWTKKKKKFNGILCFPTKKKKVSISQITDLFLCMAREQHLIFVDMVKTCMYAQQRLRSARAYR